MKMKSNLSLPQLTETLKELQLKGKKIVFTNGCFDVIHAGHIQYLQEAKKLGDFLVVGLNSDSSVRRLKGSKRPINNEKNRMILLKELRSVDFVIIFNEDTPYNVIKALKPDVLTKGGDWKVNDIVGADIVLAKGGDVVSLSFVKGLSSTMIIDKLKGEL